MKCVRCHKQSKLKWSKSIQQSIQREDVASNKSKHFLNDTIKASTTVTVDSSKKSLQLYPEHFYALIEHYFEVKWGNASSLDCITCHIILPCNQCDHRGFLPVGWSGEQLKQLMSFRRLSQLSADVCTWSESSSNIRPIIKRFTHRSRMYQIRFCLDCLLDFLWLGEVLWNLAKKQNRKGT